MCNATLDSPLKSLPVANTPGRNGLKVEIGRYDGQSVEIWLNFLDGIFIVRFVLGKT
jgi:hypothetical protein